MPKSPEDINKSRGKRYTTAERQRILAFVQAHNSQHGRGGITAAAKHFGVSALTVSAWCRRSGISTSRSRFRQHPDAPAKLRQLADLEERLAPLLAEREALRRDLNLPT